MATAYYFVEVDVMTEGPERKVIVRLASTIREFDGQIDDLK
jgi:hypothetical protein